MPPHKSSQGYLPLLIVLFIGSGCAALIYEIVWFQLLQMVIGSSAVSMGVLLGTFMGGMCLGSLGLPRLISPSSHPLRIYALLELGTGVLGVAVLWAMPYFAEFYTGFAGHGIRSILLRALISGVCLLPPTLLMGATLPAIARWIRPGPEGTAWLGFFYGGNIAGAVLGSLLAGFVLLRLYNMSTATYVASAINIFVAGISFFLWSYTKHETPRASQPQGYIRYIRGAWPTYGVIVLSGLTALGAEVIWTRLLSLMLGASVYTFSVILAVFLLGLGIGSGVGSRVARRSKEPQRALGLCQFGLIAAIGWAACLLTRNLPYWPINSGLATSPWFNFELDLVRCALAILPATFLWGLSFPLALASVASDKHDPGLLVGGVYAANTAGAIVGALGFSLFAVASIGTQAAEQLLVGLAAVSALLALTPLLRPFGRNKPSRKNLAVVLATPILAAILILSIAPTPGGLIAYGRNIAFVLGQVDATTQAPFRPTILYAGEGLNASVAVSVRDGGVRSFHVNGMVEASTSPNDMRLQRMLGHLPAMFHRDPRSVLVVGFGAGITAGTFVTYPGVERIVICEIEPLIPQVVSTYFEENYKVMKDPRVQVVYDDARHYLLTTPERFDIITSDPIHPWVKGAAPLYTAEYFELVRRHLNPGGMASQWVPLYESGIEAVKSEFATFFDVFKNGTVWSNDVSGTGYDVVLLGSNGAATINLDDIDSRLNRPSYATVLDSLQSVGFHSAADLATTYAGQKSDLESWLSGAEINHDLDLRLQYLAGMVQYAGQSGAGQNSIIYNALLSYRQFPEQLFIGSEERMRAVRTARGK